MPKTRLLPGERIEARLKPHPFSFLAAYFLAALPALWGLGAYFLLGSSAWEAPAEGSWWQFWRFLYGNAPAAYVYTVAGLGILGAAAAVVRISWRIFFLYLGAAGLAVGLTAGLFHDRYTVMLPLALAVTAPPALLAVELDRRSHQYLLTNLRIVFRGGMVVHHERQIRYEAVTDLDSQRGVLGRMLGFGTIIPVTQSGFGLGADTSQALVGVGVGGRGGGKRAGASGGIGVAAGGGKEVQVGRARSFHQLTGVWPYRRTLHLLERLIQDATSTPYLREAVELQRGILDALQGAPRPADATVPRQRAVAKARRR